jgi:hypothetical protein
MNLQSALSATRLTWPRCLAHKRAKRMTTHIHVVPIPKARADNTGAIQCVRLADHANQKSEMGKQNAAAMDMGSRSSGATLWFCFWYFFSKYSLAISVRSR